MANEDYFAEMQRRIDLAIGTRRSNCIGTALWLAQEKEVDEYYPVESVHSNVLEHLIKLKRPVKGAFVAWQEEVDGHVSSVEHMGIIKQIRPRIVINRSFCGGPFFEAQRFKEAGSDYGDCVPRFYLPNGLVR